MKFAVYQIDHEKDVERVHFENYERTIEWAGKVDPSIYQKVWEGEYDSSVYGNDFAFLDELFFALNVGEKPEGYTGTSMSVSDVVVLGEEAYFVDSVGFKCISPERFSVAVAG